MKYAKKRLNERNGSIYKPVLRIRSDPHFMLSNPDPTTLFEGIIIIISIMHYHCTLPEIPRNIMTDKNFNKDIMKKNVNFLIFQVSISLGKKNK